MSRREENPKTRPLMKQVHLAGVRTLQGHPFQFNKSRQSNKDLTGLWGQGRPPTFKKEGKLHLQSSSSVNVTEVEQWRVVEDSFCAEKMRASEFPQFCNLGGC